jgi:hypothetical protein
MLALLLLAQLPLVLTWDLLPAGASSEGAFGRKQGEATTLLDHADATSVVTTAASATAAAAAARAETPPPSPDVAPVAADATDLVSDAAPAAGDSGGGGDNSGGSGGDGGKAALAVDKLRFFVYPPRFSDPDPKSKDGYLSIWTSRLYEALARSGRKTADASAASVFFLGIETACEMNWPHYTHSPANINYLKGDFRHCGKTRKERQWQYLQTHATHLPASHRGVIKLAPSAGNQPPRPTSRASTKQHVIFDMQGYTMIDPRLQMNGQVVYTAPSFDFRYGFRYDVDIAWPSTGVATFAKQADAKGPVDCSARRSKYLAVFKGTDDWPVRHKIKKFHNGKDVIVKLTSFKADCKNHKDKNLAEDQKSESEKKHCGAGEYEELMMNTDFAFVVRGDNLYSYRFLEVLSAGAIPVVFSDGWTLPFHEVIDYAQFTVVIHEKEWATAMDVIRNITPARVCAMRKEVRRAYKAYFATFDAQLETFMTVFDWRAARKKTLLMPIDWKTDPDNRR